MRDQTSSPLPDNSQAIVTTYQFHCCGNITEWQTFISPMTLEEDVYTVRFQVFRPSSTTPNCYNLVGENQFTDVTVGENNLIILSPPEADIIAFRPGDVVGYFTTFYSDDDRNGGGIPLDSSYEEEEVWYSMQRPIRSGRRRRQARDCQYSVDVGGDLDEIRRAAPIMSVISCK